MNAQDAYNTTALDDRLKSGPDAVVSALFDLGAYDPNAMSRTIYFDHIGPLKRMIDLKWKVN